MKFISIFLFVIFFLQGCGTLANQTPCTFDKYQMRGKVKKQGDHYSIITIPKINKNSPVGEFVNHTDQYLIETLNFQIFKLEEIVTVNIKIRKTGSCSKVQMSLEKLK